MNTHAFRPARLRLALFVVLLLGGLLGLASEAARATERPGGLVPVVSIRTGNMIHSRTDHGVATLPDGRVFFVGGSSVLQSTEIYDPLSDTFALSAPMTAKRSPATATLLPDGRVAVLSGREGAEDQYGAEIYDPATGTFEPGGQTLVARYGDTATLLPNGKILLVGAGEEAQLYDPATKTFRYTSERPEKRSQPTAVLLANGRVLLAGGYGVNGIFNPTQLYDFESDTFTNTLSTMLQGRYRHTGTLLQDGRVLFTGGMYNPNFESGDTLASAELYDPLTDTFVETGSLAVSRFGHAATLLQDGRVLITGGFRRDGAVGEIELYDPAAGTFSVVGTLAVGRIYHTSSLLPDGTVLNAGGLTYSLGPSPLGPAAEDLSTSAEITSLLNFSLFVPLLAR